MFEKIWLPKALAIGVKYSEFWSLNPHIINLMIAGNKERMRMQDEQMWAFGFYIQSAVSVAIDKVFNGNKAKLKYIEEPAMREDGDEELTQEEIEHREIQMMILNEEKWISNSRAKGLPETIIN